MIKLTEEYISDKVDFEFLVVGLEGLMNEMKITDKGFQKEWYDHWIPLQIIGQETEEKVPKDVRKMTILKIKEYLESKL